MKKTLIPLLVVCLLALSGLACSALAGEDPTPTPPPTNTPLPDPTATPEPEPTAVPTEVPTEVPAPTEEPTEVAEDAGPCFVAEDADAFTLADNLEQLGFLMEASPEDPSQDQINTLISDMTAIRDETESLPVAPCLANYQKYTVDFMQTSIDFVVALGSGDESAMDAAIANFDASNSLLEGEVNRLLEEAGEEPIDFTEGATDAGGDETILVTDDTEAIQVAVPSSWSDVDGSPWVLDGDTVGASIYASPDLEDWSLGFDTPGLVFNVSDDLAKQGGYVQLLDATRTYEFLADCTYDSRGEYPDELIVEDNPIDDPIYRGKFDLYFNCGGTDAAYVVLAAVSNSDQFSNLLLVEVQLTSADDLPALRNILESFDIIGTLP